MINYLHRYFKYKRKAYHLLICLAIILIIGYIDRITGNELTVSIFYVIPISLATWYTDRKYGFLASIVCAFVWLAADYDQSSPIVIQFIPVWNTVIRLSFFIIITALLSALRKSMDRERELARIDYLTGAFNSRYFYELLQNEIDRIQRFGHPFTLAYIDLDNFKSVNDKFGHTVGDKVLCSVVISVRNHLRKTDVVARLGGDEFALLLPETNQESAHVALSKIQSYLLEEMQRSNFQVTFSIGVLTSICAPQTTDELVKMADELMYSVKCDGKNAIRYSMYTG